MTCTKNSRHLKGACVWCFDIEWVNRARCFASGATVASELSFPCQASCLTTSAWLTQAFKPHLSTSDSLALIQETFCLLSAGWAKPALASWWVFIVCRGEPSLSGEIKGTPLWLTEVAKSQTSRLGHQARAWVTPSGLHRERLRPVKASQRRWVWSSESESVETMERDGKKGWIWAVRSL